MGNHASLIRFEQQGKPVRRRGRNFIEFDNEDGKFTWVGTIDKLHYGASENQEVDTTWQPDTGAWQWKLMENDFNVHSRDYLNAGDLIEWYDTRSGESIIVDPQSINWVDNATDSRQQIAIKQAVQATIDDCKITWTDGYGSGRHFRYTAHPTRLIKHVIIDALANLPAPTVQNPYFEIEFVIKKSTGITLWIDGVAWDNSTKTTTANRIEFRLANGTVAWYFDAPVAQDSNGDTCPGIFQLRRSGVTRFCTVRFPKAWIDAAVYPIYVDDTFYDGYGQAVNTAFDGTTRSASPDTAYGTDVSISSQQDRVGLVLFNVSSLAGATVSSATLALTVNNQTNGITNTLYSILSANSGWVEAATWNYADGAGASDRWAGDTDNNGGANAGCTVSGTDYNASALGSVTTANEAVGTTLAAITLATAQVQAWIDTANYGFVIRSSSATIVNWCSSDHATTGYRPLLVVEYEEGGGVEVVTTTITTTITDDCI